MSAAPLAGRRIVVTRADDQADGLAESLRDLGAEPLLVPSIRSTPPADADALAQAAESLSGARWVGMTSPSGVRHGWPAVQKAWPGGLPDGVGTAVVGPGTADALAVLGAQADFQPSQSSGDAFAAELPVAPGDRVVLLRSDIARTAVAETLRQRGAEVTDAVAYHTVAAADPADLDAALARRPDAVTFTSPSTVRGFLAGLNDPGRLDGVALVPIGPVTAQAVTDAGLAVAAVPSDYTVAGLLAALVTLYA